MISSTPYFGRDWKLTVTPQCASGGPLMVTNTQGDDGALRCTFDIEQAANQAYWFADISIYNCVPSMSWVIQKDDPVTLEAGYQSPGRGLIFSGRVFQPVWERVNETDYRLTLHCLVGLFEDESGHVSTTIPAGSTYLDAVRQVAREAKPTPIPIDKLDEEALQKPYPRGVPVSGRPRSFFDQVAIDNHLQMWMGWSGVNIRSLASESTVPDVVYAPPYSEATQTQSKQGAARYTLIGTPQQTEWGIAFRALLDSKLALGSLVKLENVLTKRILQVPGKIPSPFFKDGLYAVARIRHIGDTRGTDWYTEVLGVTQNLVSLFEAGVQF